MEDPQNTDIWFQPPFQMGDQIFGDWFLKRGGALQISKRGTWTSIMKGDQEVLSLKILFWTSI